MQYKRRNLNMCDWNSKRNKEKEAIFEEIEGTNFPDLIKDMN